MLIEGEKWACDACVRGHRVSSCQHSDRPLTHINKKGRPVSQCPHCRGLRKARTTHVKCGCGGKVHSPADCPLVERKADGRRKPNRDCPLDTVSAPKPVGPRKQCCCSHGARCICAGKKDSSLSPVPETGLPRSPPPTGRKRPRATSAMSESILTGFPFRQNKNKHGEPTRGQPYSIPHSDAVYGSSVLAQRSADHLPLCNEFTKQDVIQCQDSMANTQPPLRRAKSENGSPKNPPAFGFGNANVQSPLDTSTIPFSVTGLSLADFDYQGHGRDSYYSSSGIDRLLGSGNLVESGLDWSTSDLSCGASDLATAYSQPTSYTDLDYNNFSHPGLASSSSGDISEVEEFSPYPVINLPKPDLYDMASVSDGSEADVYHLSAPSSYISLAEAQMLSADNLESIDVGTLLKPTATAPMAPQLRLAITADPRPYPVEQNLSIQQEQVFTPMDDNTSRQSDVPSVTPASNEPMWLSTPFGYTTSPISTGGSPVLQFDPWSRERVLSGRGELSPAC